MTRRIRCLIYARVSSERQREQQTIASQLAILPAFAARQEWVVVDMVEDDGLSAETSLDRPKFIEAMERAKRGEYDVLLVIDLDRITRADDDLDRAQIYKHLFDCGVRFATPSLGIIDHDNDEQRLMIGVLGQFAAYEKRKLRRRTKRGKRQCAPDPKRRISGRDPYGLRWVSDGERTKTGRYEIVEDEAAVVRLMCRTFPVMSLRASDATSGSQRYCARHHRP